MKNKFKGVLGVINWISCLRGVISDLLRPVWTEIDFSRPYPCNVLSGNPQS
jgi:hypothetical protein